MKVKEKRPQSQSLGRPDQGQQRQSDPRLKLMKDREDEIMRRVFSILQQLAPSGRLHLLQHCLAEKHRLALEAWVLSVRGILSSKSIEAPSLAAREAPARSEVRPQRSRRPRHVQSAPKAMPKAPKAMRGIASYHRKGYVCYQVSVCVQSLCMTARKVRDLDRALDVLMILMAVKQKLTATEPHEFAQHITAAVPAVLEEYGVTAEDTTRAFHSS